MESTKRAGERCYAASVAYLERVGFIPLEELVRGESLLMLDGDERVLVLVHESDAPMPRSPILHLGRVDVITMNVIGEDRALLRHHRGCDSETPDL